MDQEDQSELTTEVSSSAPLSRGRGLNRCQTNTDLIFQISRKKKEVTLCLGLKGLPQLSHLSERESPHGAQQKLVEIQIDCPHYP